MKPLSDKKFLTLKSVRVFPLIFWTALIFFASTGSGSISSAGFFEHSDKLAHFMIYMPLGFFFVLALPGALTASGSSRPVVAAVAFAAAWGFFMEILQLGIPERSFEYIDGAADALGGLFGAAAYIKISGRKYANPQ